MLIRASIVLLVMLNLGVAAWWIFRPEPTVPAATSTSPRPPRLQLASERAATTPAPAGTAALVQLATAATATLPSTPVSAAAASQCFTLGPFVDDAAVSAARGRLQPRVTRLQVRQAPTAGRGWRVWLPSLADHDAAVAMAARIDAAGFKDYYIVPTGSEANSIALGRFGNEESATRQQAALAAAGFPAQAGPLGTVTQWIDVMGNAGLDAASLRSTTGAAQARALDCAKLAAGAPGNSPR
ncbi:SPOR domain-containing protein [Cognatiluteimonas profundi]|uniref:SPOR domain-containing protein n=1 Tax=Cognatiluteimonas profundi TaxID=2594501 RepID=UPI00131AA9A3|nr:SPOR domain-containing protein [Lysobacter profundi]